MMNEEDIKAAAKRLYWTGKTPEEKTAIVEEYPAEYRADILLKAAAMERADNKANETYKQMHECNCPSCSSISRAF